LSILSDAPTTATDLGASATERLEFVVISDPRLK
jgi:hypothetical protein